MTSVKKNFLYNIIYQILTLIIPLITAPYLARTLGASGIGTYSYTYSIVNYFMLLTLLGVNNYGNRTIAIIRNDKQLLSKKFWSIYIIQLFMGIVMSVLYITYIFMFNSEYILVSMIELLFILSSILDINWFFFGIENFKATITRNSIVKICSIIFIFLFVKTPEDVWKYVLIMSSMTLLSQLLLWNYLRKYVHIIKIKWTDIKENLKPDLILFIPVIALSIYKMMDKIMLGMLSSISEVGFYENAEKIINIPLTLVSALGTVMLPRISNVIANGNIKKAKEYLEKSIIFVMFLSLAMSAGVIAVGREFAPIFFGIEFEKSGTLIILLATTLPITSFANVLRTQYFIPQEKDNIYIYSVICGATINFIINFILIPKLNSIGACIGTIMAEASVLLYQIMAIKNELPIKKYLKYIGIFTLKALIMLVIVYTIGFFKFNVYIKIMIQIITGIALYGILNFKYIINLLRKKKMEEI